MIENFGTFLIVPVVGIAVGLAIGTVARLRQRDARPTRSIVLGVLSGGVAAALAFIVLGQRSDDGAVRADQALLEARAMPLVGLVLDDVPGAEARLRTALRDEFRDPTIQGPSRPLTVMTELRSNHILPALKAADTADAMAVLAARKALLKHLRDVDRPACRELAYTGIQNGDKLDATAQNLMRALLTAIEKAYRSGRAAIASGNTSDRVVSSDAEVRTLLTDAGLTADDFDKLQRLARLSSEDACNVAIRLNEAPEKLSKEQQGPLARYLAAAQ